MNDATGAGRGYAVAGGVAGAIEKCIREYYPDTKMDIQHVEGLEDCRKILLLAKMGKLNGALIEGMGCPAAALRARGRTSPSTRRRRSSKRRWKLPRRPCRPKNLRKFSWIDGKIQESPPQNAKAFCGGLFFIGALLY